jgi:hypothetical protein
LVKLGVTLSVALALGFGVVAAADARADDTRSSLDAHTRAYVKQARACLTVAGLAISVGQASNDDIQTAQAFRSASQTCDAIRSRLVSMNTDHFSKEADLAWYGVDRIKSGLNAFLAYIDTRAPSKAAEAADKVGEGSSDIRAGVAGINTRRKAYGLPRI